MEKTHRPKVLKKGGRQREGKGFSRNELKKAGSNPKEALRLKIPLDIKRRTIHEENVETVKKLLEARRTAKPSKRKSKS